MGLFDVFSKGGKYFGKAIEPKCEYCEHGKRTKDGNKVLCTKKGMVDASFHCPKFTYSPLKRIPVKQMNLVGFLEGDYDEKNDDEAAETTPKKGAPSAKPADTHAKAEPSAKPADTHTAAPAEEKKAEAPAPAPAPAPAAHLPAPARAAAAQGGAAADVRPRPARAHGRVGGHMAAR